MRSLSIRTKTISLHEWSLPKRKLGHDDAALHAPCKAAKAERRQAPGAGDNCSWSMLAALAKNGFDVTATELGVFLYPGPDGRRPADLARQCNMTRQAMNYVLTGLERRGYIERHAGPSATARIVRLTLRAGKWWHRSDAAWLRSNRSGLRILARNGSRRCARRYMNWRSGSASSDDDVTAPTRTISTRLRS